MAVRLTGIASGLDTDAIVSELVSAYSYKVQTYEKEKTKLEWTKEAWSSLNSDVYSFYTKQLGTMRYQSAYSAMNATIANSSYASVTASTSAVSGTQTLTVNSVASTAGMTGAQLSSSYTSSSTLADLGLSGDSYTFKITMGTDADDESAKSYDITVDSTTTLSGLASAIKTATGGTVTASYDATNGRFFLSSSSTGTDGNFTLSASSTEGQDLLSAIGFADGATTNVDGVYTDSDAGYSASAGTDASITLNGATFTSTSNKFSINGLTITAQAEGTTTVTTSVDSDSIYDKIKTLLSSYNDLINNMTSLYNADSAKGYEPLTDDEKDAMSDTEIEKWEQKIKDALLRRDSTLSTIISTFTNAMNQSYYIDDSGNAIKYNSTTKTYQVNNKDITDSDGNTISDATALAAYANQNGYTRYSLSSFGISTLGILSAADNEQYAYHIDGDSDDSNTANNTDKLLAAIDNNPDVVMGFFSALFSDTYSKVGEQMASSTLSSAYTIYNDKEMTNEMSEIEDKIDDWQEKLENLQDYWYSKFSAMETALAQLQSEQSALAGLLGS